MKVYPPKSHATHWGANTPLAERIEFLARTAATVSVLSQGEQREATEEEVEQLRPWAEQEARKGLS